MPSRKKLASLRLEPDLLDRLDTLISRTSSHVLVRPSRNVMLTAWITAALEQAEAQADPETEASSESAPATWWIVRRVPLRATWPATTDLLAGIEHADTRKAARALAEAAVNLARKGTLQWGGLGGTRAVVAHLDVPGPARLLIGVAVPDDRGGATVVSALPVGEAAEAVSGVGLRVVRLPDLAT